MQPEEGNKGKRPAGSAAPRSGRCNYRSTDLGTREVCECLGRAVVLCVGSAASTVGRPPSCQRASCPMQQDSAAASRATPADLKQIRHLRQILLWPVHLLPLKEEAPLQHHWEHLAPDPGNPWRELDDEFGDPGEFQERHYNEFVTFLPPVQRFLYGQGIGRAVRRS